MSSTPKKKDKKDTIKLNMTFEEAMKKALSTPITNKKATKSAKKNVNNKSKG